MKKLLLFFLFSAFLDGFSQAPDTTLPLRQFNWSLSRPSEQPFEVEPFTGEAIARGFTIRNKPDTLRAIVLVTLSQNGIAHARMGFVVISDGKQPVYMDCNKKALKLPMVGWGYEVVNPNKKER